ncbi:hypothetical protein PR202_ga30770 [Eleusine coracana subsp. coracana]|uniref:DYW domain-containing protein n=1 Tax=Eleusine coracana subsp. coracana TaxID=191504 RepID=A0AAV5DQA1_ELECO|nr:hypothetical protein PR202_ga30770 [Eleusine coracana subsp. coracana]
MELQLAAPCHPRLLTSTLRANAVPASTTAPSTSCSSSADESTLKPRPRLPRRSPVPRLKPSPARLASLCSAIEQRAAAGLHREALDLFRLARARAPFTPLPAPTYLALVAVAEALREPSEAAAVAWHMEGSGFEMDVYACNRVLGMYLACRMLAEAQQVFEGMPERSAVTWGIMMGGMVDRGRPRAALALFRELWAEAGAGAGSRTVVVAIRAATTAGSLQAGRQLHCCVTKMDACDDGNQYLGCALLDMYSKCGRVDEARWVFNGMLPQQRNLVAWNSMLAAYALHGCNEEALELYNDMCVSGIGMDQFTFSTMLGVFSRLGLLEHAKQAHAGLIQRGVPLDVVGNTALVDLYCKWGRIEDARSVFERMPKRNLISWNALIAGYGYHGMGDQAIEMFDRLIAEGIAPNHVTFLAVLNACRFSGLVEEGKKIFQFMTQNQRVKPRAMHYACAIELFGREGLLDEAYLMIRRAPLTPTANMWGGLLTASRIHKNMHLAKLAAEQLLAMEPEKINSYVVLLNLYISSGRQDDAHKKIYSRLDALMKEIKEIGYVAEEDVFLPDIHPDEQKISRVYHSERLAIAFGLISTSSHTSLRITQSHRLCGDCHEQVIPDSVMLTQG